MPDATRLDAKLTMVAPPGIHGLPLAELQQLLLKLLEENAEQKRVIGEGREEIARLKGLKGGRPTPSIPTRPPISAEFGLWRRLALEARRPTG